MSPFEEKMFVIVVITAALLAIFGPQIYRLIAQGG